MDDGSTDNSWEIIRTYKFPSHFKLIIFRLEHNQGCGSAKRKCVELATGDFCGFLDPDDTLMSVAIELMVQAHSQHSKTSLISSKFIYVDENLQFESLGVIGEQMLQDTSYLCYAKNAITAFATFKLKKYRETDGINPKLKRAIDQDLYYKLEEVGQIHFLNEYLYNYRITNKSISANDNSFKADYWHVFVVMNDARKRRRNNRSVKNLGIIEYAKRKNSHFVWRIKLATEESKIIKKYFFTLRALLNYPFQNTFYLFKCLIIPRYA